MLSSALLPRLVLAQNFENPLTGEDSLFGVICSVRDGLVPFLLVLGSMAFVAAAVFYFTSGGDERRITQARRALYVGVIGIILTLLSYGFPTIIAELFDVASGELPPQC